MLRLQRRDGTTTLQVYNMTIFFSDGQPVAFQRGAVKERRVLVDQDGMALSLRLRLSTLEGMAGYKLAGDAEFEEALHDNLRAAVRRLSDSYDVVHESKKYCDVLLKAAEQLEIIDRNEWADVGLIKEAVSAVVMFLTERMVGLIRESNQERHFSTLADISMHALKDALTVGRLRPSSKNAKGQQDEAQES